MKFIRREILHDQVKKNCQTVTGVKNISIKLRSFGKNISETKRNAVQAITMKYQMFMNKSSQFDRTLLIWLINPLGMEPLVQNALICCLLYYSWRWYWLAIIWVNIIGKRFLIIMLLPLFHAFNWMPAFYDQNTNLNDWPFEENHLFL